MSMGKIRPFTSLLSAALEAITLTAPTTLGPLSLRAQASTQMGSSSLSFLMAPWSMTSTSARPTAAALLHSTQSHSQPLDQTDSRTTLTATTIAMPTTSLGNTARRWISWRLTSSLGGPLRTPALAMGLTMTGATEAVSKPLISSRKASLERERRSTQTSLST